MDLECERVLKLIFPDGLPENLRDNPELQSYLSKLGTYKVDQLKKEQARLAEETKHILEQTQDLAISNYKTFIHTAENSRTIFREFQNAEEQLATMIEKLPEFSEKCETFLNGSAEINENRRINTITLKKNAKLLEILELPQLMERCIREGRYEEALELASYVQKMGQNQNHIPVINTIVSSVEALWHTMLVQLIAQLRTDLQLPKCLQIVGYLRRMQAFGNHELKLKFLQARDTWLTASLEAISKDDAQQHLTKTIEVTRINLFNIITQYRAIFPDEEENTTTTTTEPVTDTGTATTATNAMDTSTSKLNNGLSIMDSVGDRLFQAWLHKKIDDFLHTLEFDLQRDISSFDTVLGQSMYFGLSFSRVGADFRALMVPIFVRVIGKKFENSIKLVNQSFERALDKYTLINKVTLHTRAHSNKPSTKTPTAAADDDAAATAHTDALDAAANKNKENDSLAPPETLLDFQPLALLCNGYLNALNELRLCAPIALVNDVTHCLEQSLQMVAVRILTFYRQEQQAFTSGERETFGKLCSCFAYDLLAYLQRCIHAIFPTQTLMTQMGVSLTLLEQQHISFLNHAQILEPLRHLLPKRIEPTMAKPAAMPKVPQTEMNANQYVLPAES